jgi:superfamily II DNA helicase RecQ
MKQWMSNHSTVMVATNAFGMGSISLMRVRSIHYNYQIVLRAIIKNQCAGRMAKPSVAHHL